MSLEEAMRNYDKVAESSSVGVAFWLDVYNMKKQEQINEDMRKINKQMLRYTKIMTILTVVVVIATVITLLDTIQ